jgi:hypothetical protein
MKSAHTLKGSQRMGSRRIFLKKTEASLFNDDLSNEPNFGWSTFKEKKIRVQKKARTRNRIQ